MSDILQKSGQCQVSAAAESALVTTGEGVNTLPLNSYSGKQFVKTAYKYISDHKLGFILGGVCITALGVCVYNRYFKNKTSYISVDETKNSLISLNKNSFIVDCHRKLQSMSIVERLDLLNKHNILDQSIQQNYLDKEQDNKQLPSLTKEPQAPSLKNVIVEDINYSYTQVDEKNNLSTQISEPRSNELNTKKFRVLVKSNSLNNLDLDKSAQKSFPIKGYDKTKSIDFVNKTVFNQVNYFLKSKNKIFMKNHDMSKAENLSDILSPKQESSTSKYELGYLPENKRLYDPIFNNLFHDTNKFIYGLSKYYGKLSVPAESDIELTKRVLEFLHKRSVMPSLSFDELQDSIKTYLSGLPKGDLKRCGSFVAKQVNIDEEQLESNGTFDCSIIAIEYSRYLERFLRNQKIDSNLIKQDIIKFNSYLANTQNNTNSFKKIAKKAKNTNLLSTDINFFIEIQKSDDSHKSFKISFPLRLGKDILTWEEVDQSYKEKINKFIKDKYTSIQLKAKQENVLTKHHIDTERDKTIEKTNHSEKALVGHLYQDIDAKESYVLNDLVKRVDPYISDSKVLIIRKISLDIYSSRNICEGCSIILSNNDTELIKNINTKLQSLIDHSVNVEYFADNLEKNIVYTQSYNKEELHGNHKATCKIDMDNPRSWLSGDFLKERYVAVKPKGYKLVSEDFTQDLGGREYYQIINNPNLTQDALIQRFSQLNGIYKQKYVSDKRTLFTSSEGQGDSVDQGFEDKKLQIIQEINAGNQLKREVAAKYISTSYKYWKNKVTSFYGTQQYNKYYKNHQNNIKTYLNHLKDEGHFEDSFKLLDSLIKRYNLDEGLSQKVQELQFKFENKQNKPKFIKKGLSKIIDNIFDKILDITPSPVNKNEIVNTKPSINKLWQEKESRFAEFKEVFNLYSFEKNAYNRQNDKDYQYKDSDIDLIKSGDLNKMTLSNSDSEFNKKIKALITKTGPEFNEEVKKLEKEYLNIRQDLAEIFKTGLEQKFRSELITEELVLKKLHADQLETSSDWSNKNTEMTLKIYYKLEGNKVIFDFSKGIVQYKLLDVFKERIKAALPKFDSKTLTLRLDTEAELGKRLEAELGNIFIKQNTTPHGLLNFSSNDVIESIISNFASDKQKAFNQTLNTLLDTGWSYNSTTLNMALNYVFDNELLNSTNKRNLKTGVNIPPQTQVEGLNLGIEDKQYKLNEIDINYIGEDLLGKKNEVSFLGAVGNGHKDIDINTCLHSNFNQLINDNKKLVGIYNPGNNQDGHWVTFVLVKNGNDKVSVFFKDSLGNNINHSWYKQLKESIENVCKENHIEISQYISGLEKEQTDDTSCGIFALANANIIVDMENFTEEDFHNLKFVLQSDCSNTLRAEYSKTFNQVQSFKAEKINKLENQASKIRKFILDSTEYNKAIKEITEILQDNSDLGLTVRPEILDSTDNGSDITAFEEFSSKNSENKIYVGISFGIGRTLLNHNKYQIKLEFSKNITSKVKNQILNKLSENTSINEIKNIEGIELHGDNLIQGNGLKIADIEYNLKQLAPFIDVGSDDYYLLDNVIRHDEALKELEKWYNTNTDKSHYLSVIHIINEGMHHACILKAFKDQNGLYIKLIDPLSEEDSNFINQLNNLSKSIEGDLSRNVELVECGVIYSGMQDKNYGTCGDMCLIMIQQLIEGESATYQLTNEGGTNSNNEILDQFNYTSSSHEECYGISVAGDVAA